MPTEIVYYQKRRGLPLYILRKSEASHICPPKGNKSFMKNNCNASSVFVVKLTFTLDKKTQTAICVKV